MCRRRSSESEEFEVFAGITAIDSPDVEDFPERGGGGELDKVGVSLETWEVSDAEVSEFDFVGAWFRPRTKAPSPTPLIAGGSSSQRRSLLKRTRLSHSYLRFFPIPQRQKAIKQVTTIPTVHGNHAPCGNFRKVAMIRSVR